LCKEMACPVLSMLLPEDVAETTKSAKRQRTEPDFVLARNHAKSTDVFQGPFAMTPLNYSMTSLQPSISAETIEYHYGRHFKGYVNRLNALIVGTYMASWSLERIMIHKNINELTKQVSIKSYLKTIQPDVADEHEHDNQSLTSHHGSGGCIFMRNVLANQKRRASVDKTENNNNNNSTNNQKAGDETFTDHHHHNTEGELSVLLDDEAIIDETIPQAAQHKIISLAGQVWNHDFYWKCMKPVTEGDSNNNNGQPNVPEKLLLEINAAFGSFKKMKRIFTEEAAEVIGSGWVWLVRSHNNNQLEIVTTTDCNNPLTNAKIPLLVCDVWEHAYYIDYRNNRMEYLNNWWKLVDWDFVNSLLK